MGASDDDGQAWERAAGAACRPLAPSYAPRSPEHTPLHRTAMRVLRLLKGVLGDEEPDVDALAELCAASMTSRSSSRQDATPKRLTAFLEGFSLHAGVHLHAHDRRGFEQLCRYGARGAIALSRLSELDDGRYAYRMKRPLPDGRTHLVLDGVGLLKKLAPLIPPPRFHLWGLCAERQAALARGAKAAADGRGGRDDDREGRRPQGPPHGVSLSARLGRRPQTSLWYRRAWVFG